MKALVTSLACLTLTAVLAAQLPAAWQGWEYSAPVVVPPAGAARLVGVKVPGSAIPLMRRDFSDLRVIDAGGGEVPFVLLARTGGRIVARRQARLLEPTSVKGQYLQVVADAGEDVTVHNSAELRFETSKDLLGWVEVAVGSDLKEWRVVRDRAPIYVLRKEQRGEDTRVTYPESASRYLRFRIFDAPDSGPPTMVEVARETALMAEREAAGIDLAASTDAQQRSVWTSRGDASAWPVSRVEFQAPQTPFYRHVVVERADTDGRWQQVAEGNILRAPDGGRERAWLTVDFPETHAARWRIVVENRNDSSSAGVSPALMTTVRRVVLKHEPGERYRLLYGNPVARMPGYDLAQLTSADQLEAAEPVTVGDSERNAGWVDPSPWTERYDAVLWVALIGAVAVLGAVAVRTLRASAADRPRV